MPRGVYFRTEENRRNIGLAGMGRKPWNKGKTGIYSEETLLKISLNNPNRGKPNPQLTKANLERVYTPERRKEMSKRQSGIKGSNWRGGITPINETARHSVEGKLWIKSVFERDGYRCMHCNKKGITLNAHHILNFSTHKNVRYAIDNGETLCFLCHREFHKTYGFKNNTRKQFNEWNSISRRVQTYAPSKAYVVRETRTIQGLRVASPCPQDNHSNNGISKTEST